MLPDIIPTWLDVRYWRNILINAFLVVIMGISLLILISILGADYWNRSLVAITRDNPESLGVLCVGQSIPVRSTVTIKEPTIVAYYTDILDEKSMISIVGQQQIYLGFQHPIPGTFHQEFPWRVPRLDDGNYIRSFAARGTNTSKSIVFITSTFTIGEDCNVQ